MAYTYDSTNSLEAGTSQKAYLLPLSPYSSLAGALDMSNPSNDAVIRGREWVYTTGAGLISPSNHRPVPQVPFSEELATPKSYPDKKYSPITFQLVDFPEVGVRISKIIEREAPRIAGGGDKVLDIGDREIRVWLLWPGYDEPLQRRMKTHGGTITRDTLLLVVTNLVLHFIDKIKSSELQVKEGYEPWAIGTRPDGQPGITGPELLVTRLIHRGGANWQPELWAPRFN
ncbi:hypothetical protein AX15_004129 [Amanita polypyramis BW_CC]|nr:hypothetical protein AX15_004129 [Amanita polypyramis BW_CC]